MKKCFVRSVFSSAGMKGTRVLEHQEREALNAASEDLPRLPQERVLYFFTFLLHKPIIRIMSVINCALFTPVCTLLLKCYFPWSAHAVSFCHLTSTDGIILGIYTYIMCIIYYIYVYMVYIFIDNMYKHIYLYTHIYTYSYAFCSSSIQSLVIQSDFPTSLDLCLNQK